MSYYNQNQHNHKHIPLRMKPPQHFFKLGTNFGKPHDKTCKHHPCHNGYKYPVKYRSKLPEHHSMDRNGYKCCYITDIMYIMSLVTHIIKPFPLRLRSNNLLYKMQQNIKVC